MVGCLHFWFSITEKKRCTLLFLSFGVVIAVAIVVKISIQFILFNTILFFVNNGSIKRYIQESL
jgi:hypothetical protein